MLHTRASGQRHREHVRLPSPVQPVAGHAASAQCTTQHVKKKAKVRPKEDTTSVFFKAFWGRNNQIKPQSVVGTCADLACLLGMLFVLFMREQWGCVEKARQPRCRQANQR